MSKNIIYRCFIITVIVFSSIQFIEGKIRKCFSCRSRGKLGDCQDPFLFNATHLVDDVEAVPCASGWCSKEMDGDAYGEDHDLATERRCIQRPPSDGVPRCAEAIKGPRKIFICFCQGNLCNSSTTTRISTYGVLLVISSILYKFFLY